MELERHANGEIEMRSSLVSCQAALMSSEAHRLERPTVEGFRLLQEKAYVRWVRLQSGLIILINKELRPDLSRTHRDPHDSAECREAHRSRGFSPASLAELGRDLSARSVECG
jgi:hypothetical protein